MVVRSMPVRRQSSCWVSGPSATRTERAPYSLGARPTPLQPGRGELAVAVMGLAEEEAEVLGQCRRRAGGVVHLCHRDAGYIIRGADHQ